MRVFNLAEELEKERKKNKELEEIINKIEAIVYADMSNIDVRISIQEIIDKLNILKGDNK